MVNVVYPTGWLHVERDRIELFGMVHERIDQLPLATADADTIVRSNHKHRRFRLEFLQELRALFEAFIIVDPYIGAGSFSSHSMRTRRWMVCHLPVSRPHLVTGSYQVTTSTSMGSQPSIGSRI